MEQEEGEQKEMEQEEGEQEPMEQKPLTKSGPDGTVTDLSADVVHCRNWLAVLYDQNWWLAKAVTVDTHHQDVEVEFSTLIGPTHDSIQKEVERTCA